MLCVDTEITNLINSDLINTTHNIRLTNGKKRDKLYLIKFEVNQF